MTYCDNCEASLTETDYDCGRCTQCGHQITTEETRTMKTNSDNLKLQLDAAGRAHMMAMQRGDRDEVDKQQRRIRRLLKQAAKVRS